MMKLLRRSLAGNSIPTGMRNIAEIRLQARALWARVASHFKAEWTLDDYPIIFRFQQTSASSLAARLKPVSWSACIVNWPGPTGAGGSKSEALADLRKNFDEFKLNNRLPRPGTRVRVQFASTNRVDGHLALAKDFLKRILDLDWAWISDESCLSDFHTQETDGFLIEKIRAVYAVDVSDISNGNLAEIFDRIAAYSRPIQ